MLPRRRYTRDGAPPLSAPRLGSHDRGDRSRIRIPARRRARAIRRATPSAIHAASNREQHRGDTRRIRAVGGDAERTRAHPSIRPPPADATPMSLDEPSAPAQLMAAAWAAEMLHIDFYAHGISLPHHARADFQEQWREIARELGFPRLPHGDTDEIAAERSR